jgi:phage host-nuclease inhibitor protein Gam
MSKEMIDKTTKMYELIDERLKLKQEEIEDKKEALKDEYKDKVLDLEMEIKSIRMNILDLKKEQRIKIKELDESLKSELEMYEFQTKVWREANNGRAFLN